MTTDKAPRPMGPYSQAVIEGNLVFLAGQGPVDPATGKLESGDVRAQTALALKNVRAILEAAGSSLDKVIRCNVYLRDIADFAAMNEVYSQAFSAPYPARTTIQAGALPGGIAVEIECVARLRDPAVKASSSARRGRGQPPPGAPKGPRKRRPAA